jgi:hypothetical protein
MQISKDPIQNQLWEKVNQEGEARSSQKLSTIPASLAENPKLGFLMESPFADYLTSKVYNNREKASFF